LRYRKEFHRGSMSILLHHLNYLFHKNKNSQTRNRRWPPTKDTTLINSPCIRHAAFNPAFHPFSGSIPFYSFALHNWAAHERRESAPPLIFTARQRSFPPPLSAPAAGVEGFQDWDRGFSMGGIRSRVGVRMSDGGSTIGRIGRRIGAGRSRRPKPVRSEYDRRRHGATPELEAEL
jgi:hypothetical protein